MSILDITLTAIDTETTSLDTATAQVWALNRFGHEMPEASRAAFEDAAKGR